MTYALPVIQPSSRIPEGRKPAWLKVRAPGGPNYMRLKSRLREWNLHSVCEEAHCPNIGECWEDATATFMILGDICTRNCGYCAVTHGKPVWEDREEPERIGRAVGELGLEYVVITSVNRDDLADGGAAHWAATVRAVGRHAPRCRVEVLIPDFQGRAASLETVLDARPDILNHNTETVERLYKVARHGGRYARALGLFRHARAVAPEIPTKSGIILGLGEERDELVATLRDLRAVGVSILTLGQYLRPSPQHLPVARYYRPDELGELVGTVVARDGQVLRRRPKVLAERQDRHPDRAQIAQGRDQLIPLFAETQDDPRFGRNLRRDRARVTEEPERARVTAAVPRDLVETLHRLGVVIQDVRPRGEDRLERRGAALKVGDQD